MRINSNPYSAQNANFGVEDDNDKNDNDGQTAGHDSAKYHPVADDVFARIGVNQVAYMRPFEGVSNEMPFTPHEQEEDGIMTIQHVGGVGIYAADGQKLAEAENYEQARSLILQNSLVPVLLH